MFYRAFIYSEQATVHPSTVDSLYQSSSSKVPVSEWIAPFAKVNAAQRFFASCMSPFYFFILSRLFYTQATFFLSMGRVSSINAIFHIMVGWVALRVFTYAVVYMGTAFCHSFFCSALCESRVTWRLPYFMCHTLFTDMCIFYCAVSYFFSFCPGSSF